MTRAERAAGMPYPKGRAKRRRFRAQAYWWLELRRAHETGPQCDGAAECGGRCVRKMQHHGPCLCSGDKGEPNTCPA